jgi:Pyridine nucleotide-disulphide oxidoreductase/2-oxoacid dehydrogenases acyltransferase (catalytic domain)
VARGTFAISSLGGIGGTHFTPIVNAPEVAILGVVRSRMAPVWDGREFRPRLMLPLCLSYDHRVIDGALAAPLPAPPLSPARRRPPPGALRCSDMDGPEMATVYSALGSRVTVVELMDQIIPGADRDIVMPLQRRIQKAYENVRLSTRVTAVEAGRDRLHVRKEGPQGAVSEEFHRILVAVGRRANGRMIDAENTGVEVDERRYIHVDRQMRTSVPHIFAIGDIVGEPMLARRG